VDKNKKTLRRYKPKNDTLISNYTCERTGLNMVRYEEKYRYINRRQSGEIYG